MRFYTVTFLLFSLCAPHAPSASTHDARQTIRKAAQYYANTVASHGGYVYYYSDDLTQRWGEGKASIDTIFVQPPGTPTVGMAYLKAWRATGDPFLLNAARKAAQALMDGQLESGGWQQVVHFAPPERGRMGKYRHGRGGGTFNASSLDDDQTQSALQFLMQMDQAFEFRNAEIHEAVMFGLDALLKAQFTNGAFPQVWTGAAQETPVVKAHYPDDDWRTKGRLKDYWNYYTLNDGLAGTVAETLIAAHRTYGDPKFKTALAKLGDFLMLAQMPLPQPAWCQQYNYETIPIWARKFEPPAIATWESQDVMETLIQIARHTKDEKYLEPIPRALDYLTEQCLRPDGRMARFHELQTNRPLFLDKKYQITYEHDDTPSHYSWFQKARLQKIQKNLDDARQGKAIGVTGSPQNQEQTIEGIINRLDAMGRWVSTYDGEPLVGQPKFQPGFRYLSSEVFSRKIEALSEYILSNETAPPLPKAKAPQPMESIRLTDDGQAFRTANSGRPFVPWGVNYDHDAEGRLIEDYWEEEWPTVVQDFQEIKELGANVVRVHLQLGMFMRQSDQPNTQTLDRLDSLLELAEETGLYLDITGLGCYHKQDVPPWYDSMTDEERWTVQARFWEEVARIGARSHAVFCYDLMNEPVVTAGSKKETDWLLGELGGKFFVQRINRDGEGRTNKTIAKAWVDRLTTAIRKHDRRHLITVGVIPWAHTFPGARPLFYDPEVGNNLDFVSVHFYPETGKLDKALKALAVYDVGKPLVIEEMFPLKCTIDELSEFIEQSKGVADGWMSFYWGKRIDEYHENDGIAGAIIKAWLERFKEMAMQMKKTQQTF